MYKNFNPFKATTTSHYRIFFDFSFIKPPDTDLGVRIALVRSFPDYIVDRGGLILVA